MDITKCSGQNCPVKEKCYRFTAPDSQYQSYFVIPPIKTTEEGELDCEHYWGKGEPFKHINKDK